MQKEMLCAEVLSWGSDSGFLFQTCTLMCKAGWGDPRAKFYKAEAAFSQEAANGKSQQSLGITFLYFFTKQMQTPF